MTDKHAIVLGAELDSTQPFSMPADVVTEVLAVVGQRGSGKTTTVRKVVEAMVRAGIPVAVFDTLGVWWGLRSNAEGTGPGLPVTIFGGPHADVPITPGAGAIIAETLLEHRIPAVIDTSGFRKAEALAFATDFVETLYFAAGRTRQPLHVVFDEVDELAPQKGGTKRLSEAMEDFFRRGRSRGLGGTQVSQRPSVISKDILTQASALIVHNLSHNLDVKAVTDWMAANDPAGRLPEVRSTLATLEPGTAWVWSPQWLGALARIRVDRPHTFDSSATPKVGQSVTVPKQLAKVDLARLGARIQEAADTAATNDPARLREQLAIARQEIAVLNARKPVAAASGEPVTIEVPVEVRVPVEVPVLTDADRAMMHDLAREARNGIEAATERLGQLEDAIRTASEKTSAPAPAVPKTTPTVTAKAAPKPAAAANRDPSLGRAETTILTVLAQHGGMNIERLSLFSGYKIKSSSLRNALGTLRTAGYAIGDRSNTEATPEGIAALGKFDPLPTGRKLADFWLARFGKAENTILETIVSRWPNGISNDEIANETGYSVTSSSLRNALGTLRTAQLVTGNRDRNVAAADFGRAYHEETP